MYNEDICRAELSSFSLNRIKPIYKGHKLLCFGALSGSLADERWQKRPLWVGDSIIVHYSVFLERLVLAVAVLPSDGRRFDPGQYFLCKIKLCYISMFFSPPTPSSPCLNLISLTFTNPARFIALRCC